MQTQYSSKSRHNCRIYKNKIIVANYIQQPRKTCGV
nr:MAG TPA: hypothetical protein [Caudoviricetes sp.]